MANKSTSKTEQTPAFNPEKLSNNLKNELRTYLDEKLDERFLDNIENANRKLLREKSRKIIFRDLLILILLALSIFLATILYNEGYFNRFFNGATSAETSKAESSDSGFSVSVKESEKKSPTLDELKEKYAFLLDNFKLKKSSVYAADFTSGKITDNLKLYFALNSLNFDSLKVEDESNLIDRAALLSASEKLFETSPALVSFEYNGAKVRYFEALEIFISDSLLKKSDSEDLINLEITEIKEEGDKISIKTSSALAFTFKDKKLISLSKISEN